MAEFIHQRPNTDPVLVREVTELLSAIEDSINDYVYGNKRHAYRTVSINLNTVLFDTNSARSWSGKSKTNKCLLELCVEGNDKVLVNSFNHPRPDGDKKSSLRIYQDPQSIIWYAIQNLKPVDLLSWFNEFICIDIEGKEFNMKDALKWVRDKSGAHSINDKNDPRTKFIFAFGPEDLTNDDHERIIVENRGRDWEHFVIDAGMRVLESRTIRNNQWVRIFKHSVRIPRTNPGKFRILRFAVEKR